MPFEKVKQPKTEPEQSTFLTPYKRPYLLLRQCVLTGAVALMEVTDKATGKTVAVLCTVHPKKDDKAPEDPTGLSFTPIATMLDPSINPDTLFVPPAGIESNPDYKKPIKPTKRTN